MNRKLELPDWFSTFGYRTMIKTDNEQSAGAICGQKLEVYRHDIDIALAEVRSEIKPTVQRIEALWSILYRREDPVRDAEMLAMKNKADVYKLMCLSLAGAAVACSAWTFEQLGVSVMLCVLGGVFTTAVLGAVMYFMHSLLERFKGWSVVLEVAVGLLAVGLCIWGVAEFARGRTRIVEHQFSVQQSQASQSFVDDPSPQDVQEDSVDHGLEKEIYGNIGASLFAFAMAGELSFGIALALWLRIRNDEDYVAWGKLGTEIRQLGKLESAEQELMMWPSIAKNECIAGILEAKADMEKQSRQRQHPSYYRRAASVAMAVLLFSIPASGLF